MRVASPVRLLLVVLLLRYPTLQLPRGLGRSVALARFGQKQWSLQQLVDLQGFVLAAFEFFKLVGGRDSSPFPKPLELVLLPALHIVTVQIYNCRQSYQTSSECSESSLYRQIGQNISSFSHLFMQEEWNSCRQGILLASYLLV